MKVRMLNNCVPLPDCPDASELNPKSLCIFFDSGFLLPSVSVLILGSWYIFFDSGFQVNLSWFRIPGISFVIQSPCPDVCSLIQSSLCIFLDSEFLVYLPCFSINCVSFLIQSSLCIFLVSEVIVYLSWFRIPCVFFLIQNSLCFFLDSGFLVYFSWFRPRQGVWNRREIQLTRPALYHMIIQYTCFADGSSFVKEIFVYNYSEYFLFKRSTVCKACIIIW